ncbi:MAG TPA: PAS domain S-box protein, partial [Acidimicrobiales bacterium]|nr:PAS domain S-box protein [Acidimicrobiales bacterium]
MVGGRAQLLEALVLASPDAVVVVGDSGRIEMASPAVAALFGYRPEELVGQDVEVLVPEGLRDLHRRHRRSYKARPQARPMGSGLALEGRRKDGTVFPLDVSLA